MNKEVYKQSTVRLYSIQSFAPIRNQSLLLDTFSTTTLHTKTRSHNRLAAAIKFINDNIENSIKVKDIAAAVYLSEFHFSRLFSTTFHISPHQYLLKKKLVMSANLLQNTNEPINVIADKAGFANLSTFSRAFKTCFGTSPTMYRKSTLNNA